MVGILTTAAGAIIYDVLGLYVALIIAVIYIAYGIWISYVKQNEVLTSFVAFTSLLLPYLLEYMDFSGLLIVGFVLVLMVVLQLVIVKHQQRIALYVTTFFAVLAIAVVETTDADRLLFALSYVAILKIFLYSRWRLYDAASKWKTVYEGLLFSASAFILMLINFMVIDEKFAEGVLIVTLLLFAGAAWYVWKQGARNVFDVVATLALLTLMNVFLMMNLPDETERLLVALSAFAGLMVALKLRASFMKVTYTFVFMMTSLVIFTINDVEPFFTLENITLLLLIAMMVAAFMLAKRPKEELTKFEQLMSKVHAIELAPVFIMAFSLLYMYKIDLAYFTDASLPYCTLIFIALAMALAITAPSQFAGKLLPVFLVVSFFFSMAILTLTYGYNATDEVFNIVTRLLYIAMVVAILVDLYMEGSIYTNWQKYLASKIESCLMIGTIVTVGLVMSLSECLSFAGFIGREVSVIMNTVSIFVAAGIALMLGTKREFRNLKLTGFGLLVFGIFKLIFFDLSSLDLLIRSVLFIVIGGVGLLLSNRLLRK